VKNAGEIARQSSCQLLGLRQKFGLALTSIIDTSAGANMRFELSSLGRLASLLLTPASFFLLAPAAPAINATCPPSDLSAKTLYLKAHALNSQSKFEEALPLLNQAIEQDPRFTDAYISRSFSYGKLGKIDKAIKDVQKVLELDSNNEIAYNNRGFLYLRLGQYDKAIADFTKAVALNPGDEAAWANRAEAYWRAGDPADALTDCSKAIGLDAGDADPYITRGDILASQGEAVRAISDYDTAIGYHPTTANSFHELGEVYFKRAEQRRFLSNRDLGTARSNGYPVDLAEAISAFKSQITELSAPKAVSDALQNAVKSGQIASCSVVDDRSVDITLKDPCSAKTFCKTIGWNSPYLVSPDVHQTTWEIQIPRDPIGKVEDHRVATTYPKVGSWSVRAVVKSRPDGELPEITAGASPAYSLAIYDSGITHIRLESSN
jgi:tetratricopeptide (TPR) repeat protein